MSRARIFRSALFKPGPQSGKYHALWARAHPCSATSDISRATSHNGAHWGLSGRRSYPSFRRWITPKPGSCQQPWSARRDSRGCVWISLSNSNSVRREMSTDSRLRQWRRWVPLSFEGQWAIRWGLKSACIVLRSVDGQSPSARKGLHTWCAERPLGRSFCGTCSRYPRIYPLTRCLSNRILMHTWPDPSS